MNASELLIKLQWYNNYNINIIITMLNSYFGVFAGMVGSIDIIAPSESMRSIAVFLERHENSIFKTLLRWYLH